MVLLVVRTFEYSFSKILFHHLNKIGRASINLGEIFNGFLQQITTPLLGIGQHLLNQGLAAVVGGMAGSRGFSDIFACKFRQIHQYQ